MDRDRDGMSDPFWLQHPFLTTWLRSTRAALELTAGSQQLLLNRSRALVDAMVEGRPGADFPIASSQRVWRPLLEWWVAGPFEAQQVVEGALTELRFSAGDLLSQLEREQQAHQHAQAERDRAREQVERELTARRQVEQERDAAQARAERERAERQRLERALAEAQRPTTASSADKPAVNVARREDDWVVVRDEAKRASGVFETKRAAVERAREIARNEGVEMHVQPAHGNGQGG